MIGDDAQVGKVFRRALHGEREIFFEDISGLAKRFITLGSPRRALRRRRVFSS